MAVYMIADAEVHDPEAYKPYLENAPAFVKKHGGEYLVRGGDFDGGGPQFCRRREGPLLRSGGSAGWIFLRRLFAVRSNGCTQSDHAGGGEGSRGGRARAGHLQRISGPDRKRAIAGRANAQR